MAQKTTTKVRQARAIALLLSGVKISDVAAELGVTEKSVDLWLKEPEFKQELIANAQRIADSTVANLIALNSKCVDVLTDILENSSDRNRLHAVKLIFERSQKWLDDDLLVRIERLEALMETGE